MPPSKIQSALALVGKRTTGDIRVHVSNRPWERDPYERGKTLFQTLGMHRTTHQNGFLIYFNYRTKGFAFIADQNFCEKVDSLYWRELKRFFENDLLSTYYENAIVMAIHTVGETLAKFYPTERD